MIASEIRLESSGRQADCPPGKFRPRQMAGWGMLRKYGKRTIGFAIPNQGGLRYKSRCIMNIDYLQRRQWPGGRILAYSGLDGRTDSVNGLVARTDLAGPAIAVKLPGECRLSFPELLPGGIFIAGDWFEFQTAGGAVRGALLDACHLLIAGPCRAVAPDRRVLVHAENGKTLVAAAARAEPGKIACDMDAAIRARQRWYLNLSVNALPEQKSLPAFCAALSVMKTQVGSPQGIFRHRWTTPDRWPHRYLWLWDSVFHAIGWRHLDPSLARDMLHAVFDMQAADGFIPLSASPGPGSRYQVTQPPTLALGVKLVNDLAPDRGWIEALYPSLSAYLHWDFDHRDGDGDGLLEWFTDNGANCRCGESGMDNSPRFDGAGRLAAVDFNAFMALECECMAAFAAWLGRADEAAGWRLRGRRLCDLINRYLWSDALGFYTDYNTDAKSPSPVMASAGLLPLICGAPDRERARRLAGQLRDPAAFGAPFPVPSMAKSDARYAKDMWRGPVWINLNWLVAYGLRRYGLTGLDGMIRSSTVAEIEKYFNTDGVFYEFYDDDAVRHPLALQRKGKCAPEISPTHQVLCDFGWTTTLYVDLLMSNYCRAPGAIAEAQETAAVADALVR